MSRPRPLLLPRSGVLLVCPDALRVEAHEDRAHAEQARERVHDETSGDRRPVVVTVAEAAAAPACVAALRAMLLDPEPRADAVRLARAAYRAATGREP